MTRPQRGRWPRTIKGRQRLTTGILLGGAVLAGYLLTVLLYPAPLIVEERSVTRVLGLAVPAARAALEDQGFTVRVEQPVPDPVIPAGRIVWQDPPSDLVLQGAPTVRIVPSAGPAAVSVPDVSQFELALGTQVIQAAGFRIRRLDTIASRTEAGIIIDTRPPSGSMRIPGSEVDVVVSRGPADIRVPPVVGLRHEDARLRLEAAGLKVGNVRTRDGGREAAGVVLDQQPAAGILAPRDARVHLVLAGERP